ncbi:hypothetical protein QBC47DRAFT_439814 [Echria macrotheca]|uniref:Uncharacterized protein n=1 Tax=Echria macrotheca TaxID=438768 RepID=A0AAJ0B173_9PEZI|nr:hypothetical protein QBC47DRAFT_439814 [Echria macrotheca]
MLFKGLAAFAALVIGVSAGDSVHLVNCGEGVNGSQSADSVVVFCADDSNCHFNPAPDNFCTVSDGGQLTTWERDGSCAFDTGVTFNWSIEGDARNQPLFSAVGHASNGQQSFTCFKDNSPFMYTDSFGQSCVSIYFCL